MNLNENSFKSAIDQATSHWEVKTFAVMSKESMVQLNTLEGSLRLESGVAVTVKLISIESLQSDGKAAAKIKKWAESGRLGGAKEDGTLLFREDLAQRMGETHTVIMRNKATGEEETLNAAVESISDENYQIVQTALTALAEALGAPPAEKDIESKAAETKAAVTRPHTAARPSDIKQKLIQQMEARLNEIVTGQDKKSQEAREKERAEEKERRRQEKEQAHLRKENLNWDIKKEGIKKEGLKKES